MVVCMDYLMFGYIIHSGTYVAQCQLFPMLKNLVLSLKIKNTMTV